MVKTGLQVMAFADQQFDSNGNLIGENTKELLGSHLDALVKWTMQIGRPHEFVCYVCEMDTSTAGV
jgi:hypothetical protein|tara:strand:+ start:1185 stop:1382 length:198 start_codon:yes stop_codon:yes gene_type:complete